MTDETPVPASAGDAEITRDDSTGAVPDAPAPAVPPRPLTPTAGGERIATIDIVRGLALFGILAANMRGFAGPSLTYFMPARYWPLLHDRVAQAFIDTFIQSKFITIFAFLFGVGFAVQLERADERGSRFGRYYWRRAGILALFGLAHGLLVWFGDILLVYAIVGVFLLLFRKRADRTILSWAVVLYLVPLGIMSLAYAATTLTGQAPPAPPITDAVLAEHTRIFSSGSFAEIQQQRMKDAVAQNWGYIPFFGANVLGLFLAGVLAWRRRFFHPTPESLPRYRRMAVLGLTIGTIGNATSVATMWALGITPFPPTGPGMVVQVIQVIAVPALSLGYVCAIVVLCQQEIWQTRLARFAAIGRTALSNYLLQSIIGTLLFYSYGFGLFGTAGPALLLVPTVVIYALQAVVSPWWLTRYRFAPAEWLWRSLTYGKLQPMRRERRAAGAEPEPAA